MLKQLQVVLIKCTFSQELSIVNQSIIVFWPRAGLSLQSQHSPLYPFSTFLFVSSYSPFITMYLSSDIFFCLELSSRLPFLQHPSAGKFLLSQWPSQFLFLFFISSSIILPSPILSSTTAFF